MISGIIKVSVSVIRLSHWPPVITLISTLIILDIIKTESNNCFIMHCFKENNDKRTVEEANRRDYVFSSLCAKCHSQPVNLTFSCKSCIARATCRLFIYPASRLANNL